MARDSSTKYFYRNGAGNVALIAGIIALICAFVPFVGDFVAVPAGVVAVVCGWVGVGHVDDGTASNGREAMFGAIMGGAALFVVFLVFAASYM